MADSPLVPSARLSALGRALAVAIRRKGQDAAHQATKRAISRDGKVMVDRGDAIAGKLPPGAGGTGHGGGAEPPLGNPAADGYLLSSTDEGVRSWVPPSGGGGGSLPWFDVTDAAYGATGDGTTDDTTAIAAASAALVAAGGGVLYFPRPDVAYVTSGGFTLSVPCLVLGDGGGLGDGGYSASVVTCTSTTATLFTVTALRAKFQGLALLNTAGGTPTAGAGILVSPAADPNQHVVYDDLCVQDFYDCIDIQAGNSWVMRGCFLDGPRRYALRVRNTVNADVGDWSISDSQFRARTHNATAGIRIESSGGGKIVNCKVNEAGGGRLQFGIDLANPASQTVILLVSNCSIEGYSDTGIRLRGPNWDWVILHGLQFGQYGNATGHAIDIATMTDVLIDNIAGRCDTGSPAMISIANVTRAYVGAVTNNGYGSVLSQSGNTGLIDATSGAGGAAGGDLTGSYPDPTLAASGVVAGSYPYPTLVVDSKGRITAVTSGSGGPIGSAGGDLTGSYPTPALAASGVTPGSYTNANVTVDGKGRVTAAANGVDAQTETFGVVYTNDGLVALRGDGQIVTKRY